MHLLVDIFLQHCILSKKSFFFTIEVYWLIHASAQQSRGFSHKMVYMTDGRRCECVAVLSHLLTSA